MARRDVRMALPRHWFHYMARCKSSSSVLDNPDSSSPGGRKRIMSGLYL